MMKWFFTSSSCILPFPSKSHAYEYALSNHIPINQLKEVLIPPFRPQTCLDWLNQVICLCENGHNLQGALLAQESAHFNAASQKQILAIKSILEHGESVSNAITIFLPNSIRPLASSIPLDGPEESKLAAVRVAHELLSNQIKLSQTLLKSLTYPTTIIHSALLLAALNKILTHQNMFQFGLLWAFIVLITVALYAWIGLGHAYPFLCKNIPSFRTYNVLTMLLAMLKSGEPLQRALLSLCKSTYRCDKESLYKSFLLLHSGATVKDALPCHWFSKTNHLQLDQVEITGDLCTPLEHTAKGWYLKNETILKRISKAFPILGIVIAAIFVTNTLMSLYAPLMDVNALGF